MQGCYTEWTVVARHITLITINVCAFFNRHFILLYAHVQDIIRSIPSDEPQKSVQSPH